MTHRILVVCHERDRQLASPYVLPGLIDCWRARGLIVTVQFGWDDRPTADLVIPHIDTTKIPPAAIAMFDHYPRVLNRGLTDISKRVVSANLLSPHDPWPGPVIVKTNANHAGIPDWARTPQSQLRRFWQRRRGSAQQPSPPPSSYKIYDRLAAVPAHMHRDRGLVIEKFLPERDGDLYVLRQWWILGDQVVLRRQWAGHPIAVSQHVVRRESMLIEPPPELLALRQKFGLDYGKVDFAISDGQPVIFDVATTPTSPMMLADRPRIGQLAAGIDQFLP